MEYIQHIFSKIGSDILQNVINILRNIRLNFSQSERHDEMLGLLASLLANGTNKLISMGSQPNLKFNFNWVTVTGQTNFNFNWVTAQSKIQFQLDQPKLKLIFNCQMITNKAKLNLRS